MNKTQVKKLEKVYAKEIWIDQIKTALYMANKEIEENPSDDGTCNFDCAMVKIEPKRFTMTETQEIFSECGIRTTKEGKNWLHISVLKGQADRNTRWHKTFSKWLEEQGFTTSMYYQMD